MDKNRPGSTETKLWRDASGPLLTLGVAAVIELFSRTAFKIPNPPAFLLLMVVFSGFRGGLRSGLISAAAAWLYFAYYFSVPQQPFHYTDENLRRVLVWFVTTPAIALMVGVQRRHIERMSEALYHGLFKESLRQYAERLKILHEIDRAILAAQSPEAIAAAAIREIWQLIPYRRATVGLFDFGAKEFAVLATHALGNNPVTPGTRIPLEELGDIDRTLKALRQGKVHRHDLRALSATSPVVRAVLAEGMHYFSIVPLIAQGQLLGSLSLGEESAEALTPEHIAIAREVADQLAVAIQQARLREELRQHAADLERRVAERTAELEKARRDADLANQAKSEFLSRMSHELRTPLTAVLGFAQLLEMGGLSPKQGEGVAHILKAGRHLLDLINELLDIARIEAGRLGISPEPVPLDDLARESLDLIAPLASEAGVRLDGNLAAAQGLHVWADRQRLKQVLLNLLSNAVKFNHRGGTVALTYRAVAAGRLQIKVSDTGQGIPPEQLAHLFTPFERLGADARSIEGTGLGLALSKRLIEVMGGAIGVESAPGQGSTFWIELPLAEGPLRQAKRAGAEPEARATRRGTPESCVVLYIEDNLYNLRLIEDLFADRPQVNLISTMQGSMGIELARNHRPRLILLDMHLPDIPGDEVLRRLQHDSETADIPIVVISADATRGQAERIVAAGARAYLTKPVELKELLKIVDGFLEARELDHAEHGA